MQVQGLRGDKDTSKHTARLYGACSSRGESEIWSLTCNSEQNGRSHLLETRVLHHSLLFPKYFMGVDDLTWWSHPDAPSSVLSQCCWAQGSSPLTSHAKSTVPDVSWNPVPTLISHVLTTHPCTSALASLSLYCHLWRVLTSSTSQYVR